MMTWDVFVSLSLFSLGVGFKQAKPLCFHRLPERSCSGDHTDNSAHISKLRDEKLLKGLAAGPKALCWGSQNTSAGSQAFSCIV